MATLSAARRPVDAHGRNSFPGSCHWMNCSGGTSRFGDSKIMDKRQVVDVSYGWRFLITI